MTGGYRFLTRLKHCMTNLMITLGKGGVTLHVDPIFPEGAFKVTWLAGDTSTRRPRYDFSEGKEVYVDEYSFGAVRCCRKAPVQKVATRPKRK